MKHPAVRTALAALAGLVVASLTVALTEMAAHALLPATPAGGAAERQELFVAVAFGWLLGSLLGAVAAIAISRRVIAGWIVGVVITALALFNTQSFPHPAWMVAAALALPLVAVLIAKNVMRSQLAAAAPRSVR